jgi:hypothetical protein
MYLFFKKYLSNRRGRKILSIVTIIFVALSPLMYNLQYAHAAGLTAVSNQVTDSRPSTSAVNYITKWTFPGTTAIGCMQIKYTTTASGSTKPTGMTTTAATKSSISGGGLTAGNWSLNNTTDGTLKYTHATTEATSTTAITIITANITNPSSAGIYYAQITTYTGNDCSTGLTDTATIAFSMISGQTLSVTVDPSLSFAINGVAASQAVNGATTTAATVTSANTIPLDNVNPTHNAIAAQDLVVSTNAVNGYTIYASYSGTLNDGAGHTIADWTGTNAAPTTFSAVGTSAFGYTSDDTNVSRFQTDKWAKFETWGYEVAKNTTKVSSDTTRVGYQVGVGATQEAGLYTTTIILTATPSY